MTHRSLWTLVFAMVSGGFSKPIRPLEGTCLSASSHNLIRFLPRGAALLSRQTRSVRQSEDFAIWFEITVLVGYVRYHSPRVLSDLVLGGESFALRVVLRTFGDILFVALFFGADGGLATTSSRIASAGLRGFRGPGPIRLGSRDSDCPLVTFGHGDRLDFGSVSLIDSPRVGRLAEAPATAPASAPAPAAVTAAATALVAPPLVSPVLLRDGLEFGPILALESPCLLSETNLGVACCC